MNPRASPRGIHNYYSRVRRAAYAHRPGPVSEACLGSSRAVPFRYAGRSGKVTCCASEVQMLADGVIITGHPRRTAQRPVLDAGTTRERLSS